MSYYNELLNPIKLPKMLRVKQIFNSERIEDVSVEVSNEISNLKCIDRLKNKRVAVAVGSRGINNIGAIVQTCIKELKNAGAEVFIVPAMGSHGGANAQNQKNILGELGITEEKMEVPILSSMETVIIGKTEDNIDVHFDKNASEADYTVSIARVKPHCSFRGKYESGMLKMNVIGLGKQKGADVCHSRGMANMNQNLQKIGPVSLEKSNLLFSLAILENSYDDTYKILAVPAQEILEKELELLEEAKKMLSSIPFKNLDLLVIDEIGKDITGTGMDCNIVQRFTSEHMVPKPFIKRIAVLDLTNKSDGNAAGMGLADVICKRLYDKVVLENTYPNHLTSRTCQGCKIPMIMENDLLTIKAGIKTAPDVDYDNLRIVRIKNTLYLDELEISTALLKEAEENPNIELESDEYDWKFGEKGNFINQDI